MDDVILQLENVSRSFGTQTVLQDVSLNVHAGETLVLIGESGCGKSVTMKLLMALLPPTGGHVLWDGHSLAGRREADIVRDRLQFGYLFQGAALFDSMSVMENVAFGLRENQRVPNNEVRERVVQRLNEVGLDDSILAKKPAELSGGMKKRVALARALALQPDVMFYDEPTTGLDPVMSDVINELILRIRSLRPVTSVIVTHDMHTVRKVATRVVMFYPRAQLEDHEQQIIFNGTPEELMLCDDPRVYRFVRGQADARLLQIMS